MCRRFDPGLRHHFPRNTVRAPARYIHMQMIRTAIIPLLALFTIASAQGPVAATAKLTIAQTAAKKGGVVNAVLILSVPSGHHAYAPAKENADFIPVSVTGLNGATYKLNVSYPKGVSRKYPGMDHSVSAYEGTVKIPIKFVLPSSVKSGKLVLKAAVNSQVCSNQTGVCYPPKKQMLSASVTVR